MLSPRNTPTALASNKAAAEPIKTNLGAVELPLKLKVANWLLSPNSDKKIVPKLRNNNCQSIFNPCGRSQDGQRFAPSILINVLTVTYAIASHSRLIDRIRKLKPAKVFNKLGEKVLASHLPAITPNKLVETNAIAAPANTIQG